MKILLFGANGNLGEKISSGLQARGLNLDTISRSDFNILSDNEEALKDVLTKQNYDYIINCAALIGLDVCEANRASAFKINGRFVYDLCRLVNEKKTKIIHFSTDNVFECSETSENHNELGLACPTTWYGITKLIGEKALATYKNSLIIRLPLLFSKDVINNSLTVNKLINKLILNQEIHVYNDVFNTPILIESIEPFLYLEVIKNGFDGNLIHMSGDRLISLYDLIKILAKSKKLNHGKIISTSLDKLHKVVMKPRFGGLSSIIFAGANFNEMVDLFEG
jgi:dTDP-4-dehydrorhamnose reductase